ncbi:NAD(P)/FAD-dependent oxidoreductase [Nocardia sp. CDC159]|uniref:NAD(P)/FAD-dependent oxidoreductase n=1 Tax=Nocardia pulmonis TaxID=2951408 RepID=A0A9X2J0S9_9NOCA|nr:MULTISPECIES: NAD(P)/FAD-dependent oxidoreductase [Nocardia]MCM6778883.1 NAD(P)/FAD-dependent oxidoreductase [Nocardia pulmonis]MCM6791772.1 NAD(P)/FAD-dependent oxidoreductase [Nocardia sp. CDC159]
MIVGSGLAGCTAAILLGRTGLRVALLEAHRDPKTYKRLCTSSIRSSALPTMRRIGLDKLIEDAGGVPARDAYSTPYGWLRTPLQPDRPPHGYNIRRQTLDPLVRAAAAEVAQVDLILGAKVRELTRDHTGRIDGVVARIDGADRRFGARLVIGADGRATKVAELAGLSAHLSENCRACVFAYYRNVQVPEDGSLSVWLKMPEIVSVGAMDDGHAILAGLLSKQQYAEAEDKEAALLASYAGLPDVPDLSQAERTSDVIGYRDYPSITRWRITAPGVALVGDAAMSADPAEGAGLGWALQTAEWLSDAVAKPLAAGTFAEIDAAARRYQRLHRIRLLPHQLQIVDLSRRPNLSLLMKFMLSAAVQDRWVGAWVTKAVSRNSSMFTAVHPVFLARATVAALRSRRARRSSVTSAAKVRLSS